MLPGALGVRSCLIDGEAVACDENELAVFERLRLPIRSVANDLTDRQLIGLN
jgi:ATP-dependent DNA ligase